MSLRRWLLVAVGGAQGVVADTAERLVRRALTGYARATHRNAILSSGAYAASDCQFEGPNRVLDRCTLLNVRMGRHSYCAVDCQIADCTIGRFTSIGPEVMIGLGVHPIDRVSTFPGFYSSHRHTINFHVDPSVPEGRITTIGSDVWIGARVIIPGGITIGDGAIIGAGAVVTRDVAPYAIVAGVPARLIRSRFSAEIVDQLCQVKWWNWDDDTIRSRAQSFDSPQALLARLA